MSGQSSSSPSSKVAISPDLIDLGSTVIAIHQITSVQLREQYPLRWPGLALVLAGAGLGGFDVAGGVLPLSVQAGGSLRLWGAFLAIGMGLFGIIFARRLLLIRTADGAHHSLVSADAEELETTMAAIRTAMLDGAARSRTPPDEHRFDEPRRTLRPMSGELLSKVASSNSAAPATSSRHPARSERSVTGESSGAGSVRSAVNGANGATLSPVAGRNAGSPTAQAMPSDRGSGEAGSTSARASNGSAAVTPSLRPAGHHLRAAEAGAPRKDRAAEIERLVSFIREAQVPHFDALVALLDVPKHHFLDGRFGREDAVAHWQSFRTYVFDYLSAIDGLPALTREIERRIDLS